MKLLLASLIYFAIFGLVSSQNFNAYDFLDNLEQQVKEIAAKAVENDGNAADILATCQSQNCSRSVCYPAKSQKIDNLQCVTISGTTYCSNTTSITANFGRGYVRTPPYSIDPETLVPVESYLGETICKQRELDSTFKEVNDNITDFDDQSNSGPPDFVALYLGTTDGAFRFYPGREVLSGACNAYDPRVRPWYTGATSVLTDLVVLLDTGYSMTMTPLFGGDPSLVVARNMTNELLQTSTKGDRVTLIPFNQTVVFSETFSVTVTTEITANDSSPSEFPTSENLQASRIDTPDLSRLGDWTTLPNDERIAFLNSLLNSSQFQGDEASENMQPSNFTKGLTEAFKVFDSDSPTDALKVVILITSLDSHTPSYAELFQSIEPGSWLFIFDLGDPNNETTACSNGTGYYVNLCTNMVTRNPLYYMRAYSNFQARSRISAHNGSAIPFWQPQYLDASGLGYVITVSYPVMTADGLELIGVAAIDFTTYGLGGTRQQDIENVLDGSDKSSEVDISTNPNGASINCTESSAADSSCTASDSADNKIVALCPAAAATVTELESLLCKCPRSSEKLVKLISIIVGIIGGLLCILFIIIANYYVFRAKRGRQGSSGHSFTMYRYSYAEIRRATNDFDEAMIIGKGAFGVVFRAILRNSKVAVKRLLTQPADLAGDVHAEVKILGMFRHPNLVELKGTCFQAEECFLVYELVEGGDLHAWLWPEEPDSAEGSTLGRFLTWGQRIQIARGTALGLTHLHRDIMTRGQIFHLDIKPHNILLEKDFNPKIADFGISRIYRPGYTLEAVRLGTPGYVAPEVLGLLGVIPNSKLDVYSYGMVLLQLMSGRKLKIHDPLLFLVEWARKQAENGIPERVLDKRLIEPVQEHKKTLVGIGKGMIHLALRCLSHDPESRPEMTEVFEEISKFGILFNRVDHLQVVDRDGGDGDPNTAIPQDTTNPAPESVSSQFSCQWVPFRHLIRRARSRNQRRQEESNVKNVARFESSQRDLLSGGIPFSTQLGSTSPLSDHSRFDTPPESPTFDAQTFPNSPEYSLDGDTERSESGPDRGGEYGSGNIVNTLSETPTK